MRKVSQIDEDIGVIVVCNLPDLVRLKDKVKKAPAWVESLGVVEDVKHEPCEIGGDGQ
jgi:hypothetical protein